MATKFYFNSTPQTDHSQSINPDWTGSYSNFNRYYLEQSPTSSFSTLTSTVTLANPNSYCFGQWWSHPISNASSFSSTDWNNSTWLLLMRHSEGNGLDNLVYKMQLRIWDGSSFVNNSFFTGGTEYDVGNGATTNSLMETRRCSGCDYWGTIGPFSDGIRLVMEVGHFRSSGGSRSTTAYSEIGGNSGTDLTDDQTGTSQFNPFFQCSLDFTFDAEPTGGEETPSRLMLMGVG